MALTLAATSSHSHSLLSSGMGTAPVVGENRHSSNPRADAARDRYARGDDAAFAKILAENKAQAMNGLTMRQSLDVIRSPPFKPRPGFYHYP